MIVQKQRLAKALVLALAAYPQLTSAEDFTAAQVLEWDRESQDALFQNSIAMLVIVASQKGDARALASCIGDWYGDYDQQRTKHEELIGHLERYRDRHPQVIILAFLQSRCGKFFD